MIPIQITFKDLPTSPAIESHIRKKAEKLDRFYDRIKSLRVVVDMEKKHKNQGKLYNVRIDLNVPGKELVVTHKVDKDIYVAIRDAFEVIARRLEEHARKRHGRVKTHEDVLHGQVARIIPQEGYGFIDGSDGNQYYFSLTNVSYPNFQHLLIGDFVAYLVEASTDGLQARHVIREHHFTQA